MTPLPLLILSAYPASLDGLREALSTLSLPIEMLSLDQTPGPASILLLDADHETEAALAVCRQLRQSPSENFVPLIVLTNTTIQRPWLDAGADIVLSPQMNLSDLFAQIQAFLRLKQGHDQISQRASESQRVNKRLQATYQQINQELELARRLQQSFLPQSLPDLPKVRFAVEYRPCGQVGGDFYDVFRLDENHYGFYVADAMGHGVSASLLTIFVKKGVRAKDIIGQSYRLVPPDEVLHRLNHDFIDQALSDTPFITMAYGLFNFRDGTLQFSRAGHPYPLYVPREGPIQLWQMEGSLLGVFATQYRLRTHQLLPGDKVVYYTDGMDAASFGKHPVGVPSLIAAAEEFRGLPIDQFLQRLAMDLFEATKQVDDLTLLGMEVPG